MYRVLEAIVAYATLICTFYYYYYYLIFAWTFLISWPKMGVLGGQYSGRGGAILTPNELVLTSVPVLVKIDQEVRLWECPQTDTQIHWRTDTNRFLFYSYGTDNKAQLLLSWLITVAQMEQWRDGDGSVVIKNLETSACPQSWVMYSHLKQYTWATFCRRNYG